MTEKEINDAAENLAIATGAIHMMSVEIAELTRKLDEVENNLIWRVKIIEAKIDELNSPLHVKARRGIVRIARKVAKQLEDEP